MTRAMSLSPSRFLLLPELRRPDAPRTVKRYRLARLKIEGRDPATASRTCAALMTS